MFLIIHSSNFNFHAPMTNFVQMPKKYGDGKFILIKFQIYTGIWMSVIFLYINNCRNKLFFYNIYFSRYIIGKKSICSDIR